jgi:hypothetical protein
MIIGLQMTDVEALPKSASLHYGNEVAFRFKVKDAVSGKYVRAGDVEGATVYLSLRQVTISASRLEVKLLADS